jgi:hypothetical protein
MSMAKMQFVAQMPCLPRRFQLWNRRRQKGGCVATSALLGAVDKLHAFNKIDNLV